MGRCSATDVFDPVCEAILDEKILIVRPARLYLITKLIEALDNYDWDCHTDSRYYDHPLVQQALKELHPDWFEEGFSQ